MKKSLFIALILSLLAQSAFALDIVYPKKNSLVINAKSSFFIGSSDPKKELLINGQKVNVHPSGGFAHLIPLEIGKNSFTITSGNEQLIYDITRPAPPTSANSPFLTEGGGAKEYETLKYVQVINENAPIRTTPINAGINRIAHLQKGMPLVIDGEKEDFYSVILGSNKTGWIAKSDVKIVESGVSLAELKNYDKIDTNEFDIYVFHLNAEVPFELVEGEKFTIRLFNVEGYPQNTYQLEIPVNNSYGYSGRFSGTDFIVKIRKAPPIDITKPLKGIRIAIDAGHGGNDVGAIGCLGHFEKDIMLSYAKHLEAELKRRGAIVFMTRTNDISLELRERVDMANDENSVILISLHGNAIPDGRDPITANGISIYYYYKQAEPLAKSILREMVLQTGMNALKTIQESFALVRNTNALSILIETGFLINPSDNAKLIDRKFQQESAKAIADGIEYFLRN